MTDVLAQKIADHIENEKELNKRRDEDISNLYSEINLIRTNHLPHLQNELTEVKTSMKEGFKGIENRFIRLEKMMWILITGALSAIGYFIEQFIKFIIN